MIQEILSMFLKCSLYIYNYTSQIRVNKKYNRKNKRISGTNDEAHRVVNKTTKLFLIIKATMTHY